MNSAKPTLPAQILSQTSSTSSITDRLWRHSLYNVLNQRPLDRVNVLGDNSHGHLSYACPLRSHSKLTSMESQVCQCPELDARRTNAPERRRRPNVRSLDSRVRLVNLHICSSVRIWRMDSDCDVDYPFVCKSVIQTGHKANIFNAHLLPHSTRM